MRTAFAIISILLAFSTSAREVVAEATPVAGAPIATAEIVPHAPVLEPVDVGSVPREEYETRLAAVIERIEAAASAIGILPAVIERIVAAARVRMIDPVVLAAIFAATEERGLSPADAQTVIMASIETGVDVGIVIRIAEIAQAREISGGEIDDVIALAIASGVSPAEIERVIALVAADKPFASRFDILAPCAFSQLWIIKMEAREQESRGKSTDDLYRLYWQIFSNK